MAGRETSASRGIDQKYPSEEKKSNRPLRGGRPLDRSRQDEAAGAFCPNLGNWNLQSKEKNCLAMR